MEGVLKKIKIQTGVVKRIAKEKTMYEQEAVTIRQQIEDMKTSGKDEYDIKKRIEVLEESEMMGPDCNSRLKVAIEKLTGLVEENEELKNQEVYKVAKNLLVEVIN
uniref:Tubulin-specific chaperone A n=1 Tax=Phallusia mammillata TaxID=59560 RepID=A0A6F9DVE1_9ASCI|nr:tubulin-specific chaperone A-like [Phallusia mammillata]